MDKQISKSQLRRERNTKLIKWGGATLLVALGVTALIVSLEKGINRRDVRLGAAEQGALETTVNATGRVVPAFEEVINSPVDTRILKVYAQAGDSVEEGAPLLQLDLETAETNYSKLLNERDMRRQELTQLQLNNRTQLSELAMQIEVKQMQVNQLKVEAENERRLDSLGSGTGDRVRQAETAYTTGKLELRQLRERLANEKLRNAAAEKVQSLNVSSFEQDLALMRRTLDQGRIPAPHAGVLTYIANEIGRRITAGEKVAVVSDLSQFKIEGEVAEGSSDRVGVGSEVIVRIGKTELKGTVTNLTPQAKGGVISFTVKLEDPRNPRLRSGLRTELSVSYGYKSSVLRIPNGQYFKGPGEYNLFVKDGDNHLSQRKVRLGDSNRDYVEVLSGLNAGDSVAVSDMEQFNKSKTLKLK
ncbi:aBC transporter permease [Bacteroides sp. CAG:927]|nr:aBC transporter permease [Bacteroides sp. CAG:927]